MSQSPATDVYRPRPWRLLIGLVLLCSLVGILNVWPVDWQGWAAREQELRAIAAARPLATILAAIGLYALLAGLSVPGATLMTLAYGWLFGFGIGLFVVSFGSTAGATLAFLTSRYLLRDWVQSHWGELLSRYDASIARDGALYLFTLRLLVAVPYVLVNLLAGLTRIRVFTFWWVSQLGMLPATAAYVYAGSQLPSLDALAREGMVNVLSLPLAVAFALIGLLPWILKIAVRTMTRSWESPA